jgi:hypothetical protein
VRVVRYTADVMGFHPTVTYEGNCQLDMFDQSVPPTADDLRKLILLPEEANIPVGSSDPQTRVVEESNTIAEFQPTDGDDEPVTNNEGFPEAPTLKADGSAESTAGSETKNPSHSVSAVQDNLEIRQSNDQVLEDSIEARPENPHLTEHYVIDRQHTIDPQHPVDHHEPSERDSLPHSHVPRPAFGTPEEAEPHSSDSSDRSESSLETLEYSIAEQAFRTASWNPATESSRPLQSGHSEADYSVHRTGQSDPEEHPPFAKQGFQAVEQSAESNSGNGQNHFETDHLEQQRETSVGQSLNSEVETVPMPVIRMDNSAVPAQFGPDQIIVTEIQTGSDHLRLENVPEQEISVRPDDSSDPTDPEVVDSTVPRSEPDAQVFLQDVPNENESADHVTSELLEVAVPKSEPASVSVALDVPEPLVIVDLASSQDKSDPGTEQAIDDNEETKLTILELNSVPVESQKAAETRTQESSEKLELTFSDSEVDAIPQIDDSERGVTHSEADTTGDETLPPAAETEPESKSIQQVADVPEVPHSVVQNTETKSELAESEDVPEQNIPPTVAAYPEYRAPETIPVRKPVVVQPESEWKPVVRTIPQTIRAINSYSNPTGRNSGRQITSEAIRRPESVPVQPLGPQFVTWNSPSFQVVRNPQLVLKPTRHANQQAPQTYARYRALPIFVS